MLATDKIQKPAYRAENILVLKFPNFSSLFQFRFQVIVKYVPIKTTEAIL